MDGYIRVGQVCIRGLIFLCGEIGSLSFGIRAGYESVELDQN